MDNLKDIAAFRSPTFKPFLPDGSQVNPGVYGAELAYWLASRLAASGVVTSYPEYEDWGWYIEYSSLSGSEFAVHCTNDDEEGTRWTLRLRRHPRRMFGRDKPSFREADPLIAALRGVLENEPSISEMKWLYAVSDPQA